MAITTYEYVESAGTYDYVPVPGTEDFVTVASEDVGGSYEWDVTDIHYSPSTRRYYVYSASGCSCNGPYEDFDFHSSLVSYGSKQELLSRFEGPEWAGIRSEIKEFKK